MSLLQILLLVICKVRSIENFISFEFASLRAGTCNVVASCSGVD